MDNKEKQERESVIAEAMTWLRTPYHPEARVKGAGCDCGTFILGVFENVGLIEHIILPHYPEDVACNCANPMYLTKIKEYCHEVDREPLPGDIIMYKFSGSLVPHHCSIVVDEEFCIHSYTRQGVLLSNRRGYKKFEIGLFSFW